jgi:hypothetical protein
MQVTHGWRPLLKSLAGALLSFNFAVVAGYASGSLVLALATFAALMLGIGLGDRLIYAVAATAWGEKPLILAFAIKSSVLTAASTVMAFGVLLAGHVSLNMLLADLGLAEVDLMVGILPFLGIISYSMIPAVGSAEPGKHPLRLVTRGVVAAAIVAVVLYMAHAVLNLTGIAH